MKYECHITIEPVIDLRLELFKSVCYGYGFKVANLIMVDGKPNQKDSFCTGRDNDFYSLKGKMFKLISDLEVLGFKLHRAKIEKILLDERFV